MIPKQSEIELPLLRALVQLGGKARPSEIYPLVRKQLPDLTEEDLALRLDSGGEKWKNRIQWVRMTLITHGQMEAPSRGIWAITDEGRSRYPSARESKAIYDQSTFFTRHMI